MLLHNARWHWRIGPFFAAHWPDRDAPLRNQATSQDISRIERSLRRPFLFLKTRRRCCDKYFFGLPDGTANFAALFRSKLKLRLNRLSGEEQFPDYFALASDWGSFQEPTSNTFQRRDTSRCVSMLRPLMCPKARLPNRTRQLDSDRQIDSVTSHLPQITARSLPKAPSIGNGR